MTQKTAHDLLEVLSGHIGRDNGVTVRTLADELDITERTVRELVSELRIDGVAVCGHPRDGYFIAANRQEVEETCQFLRARAMHSLVLESHLRRIPLPDLFGQLHLNT